MYLFIFVFILYTINAIDKLKMYFKKIPVKDKRLWNRFGFFIYC